MKDKIKVTIETPEGSRIEEVDQATLERLQVQREMLGEYGGNPLMETQDGEYITVKGVTVIKPI